jgi:hypothetical protein
MSSITPGSLSDPANALCMMETRRRETCGKELVNQSKVLSTLYFLS